MCVCVCVLQRKKLATNLCAPCMLRIRGTSWKYIEVNQNGLMFNELVDSMQKMNWYSSCIFKTDSEKGLEKVIIQMLAQVHTSKPPQVLHRLNLTMVWANFVMYPGIIANILHIYFARAACMEHVEGNLWDWIEWKWREKNKTLNVRSYQFPSDDLACISSGKLFPLNIYKLPSKVPISRHLR